MPLRHFRKAQRAKEVARNKKERALNRDAQSQNPEAVREQLKDAIAEEQAGSNPALRMRKKALQSAYEQAIKKQMVSSRWLVRMMNGSDGDSGSHAVLAPSSLLAIVGSGGKQQARGVGGSL